MAKKSKKKGTQVQIKISPERYIRERARKLPIGKCYVNNNWKNEGMAHVVVTRNRPNGNFVVGVYLVDTYCMGVKDAFCHNDFDSDHIEEILGRMDGGGFGMKEIPYIEAHNIIYGGIAFAEDAGIPPVKDFSLARYVLEEDTDDIPLIEYEYGRDGKYFLVCGPNDRDKLFIQPLKNKLGDDFDYAYANSFDKDSLIQKNMDRYYKIRQKFPDEEHCYDYPEYPSSLNIKNMFIAEEFAKPENYYYIEEEVRDRILNLPADEAAQDISNIIMYEIGRTYKGIEDDTIGEELNGTLMHAVIFLAYIDSNKALDAILEIMKQTGGFADYHFGDLAPELIYRALYMAGKNDVEKIEKYMYEPGHISYLRTQVLYALAMIVQNHPNRRAEIIEILRRLMKSLIDRVPRRDGCDGSFAGFVMVVLLDINAHELIPEVKELFDADCVDPTVAGDCNEVVEELNNPKSRYIDKFEPIPIEEQYRHLKSFDK